MSSMDIVAFINSTRTKGEPVLGHGNFLKKVRDEIDNAVDFYGIYIDKLGREKPCYYLDEEASTLMAMSYSKVVRKTIYRAWKALRAGDVTPALLKWVTAVLHPSTAPR